MTSLIDIVRSKYLESIRSVNPPGRWKILVVDEYSQKLLGTVLKQFDILEENVTLIESISSYRDRQPQFEAMYILMPTSANVERIIRDFTPGSERYAAAHLFFLDSLSEALSRQLVGSHADPHLRGLQDLNLNFWPLEAQAFSLKMPDQFFSLYSPPRSESAHRASRQRLEEDLQLTAKMIANACIALDEYPHIRYYMPSHHPPLGPLKPNEQARPPPPPDPASRWRTNLARGAASRTYDDADSEYVTRLLAFNVQRHLDEYKNLNAEFPKKSGTRPRGTLIITDRSMDTVAPFIHEFTFQAMSNDLLPIEDGVKYMYKFETAVGAFEDKTAVLSDNDNVYTDVRHMHMREAIDKLIGDFNTFLQENAGFKGGEGAVSLNDMKDMLAKLPQYQEQREKFSLHLNLAEECMNIFERDKLTVVAGVEQNCATGLTADGKSPKNLVEEMVPLLDSHEVVNRDKVRIIALYIQHRDGVPDEDRRRLYQHARLSLAEQDAVNSLVHLGARISRGPSDRDTKKRIKPRSSEDEYVLSRYNPLLKTVLEDHVNGRLDVTAFPYVRDAPALLSPATSLRSNTPVSAGTPTGSLRSQKPIWHKASPKGAVADTRQRVLVFVAGGMTYSEMREAYRLSKSLNKDIIIGSAHIFTPRGFMDDLKVLELQGVGSHAIPNGLRAAQGGPRPFQDFYDERYFTQDAPQQPSTTPLPNSSKSSSKLSRPTAQPMDSSSSQGSKEDKKKRKGLFRF